MRRSSRPARVLALVASSTAAAGTALLLAGPSAAMSPSPSTSASPSVSPSSSATATATSPTAGAPSTCTAPATLAVEPGTVVSGRPAQVSATASPGRVVRLFAYSRPSTSYQEVREATTGDDGRTTFTVHPPTNTRMYLQQDGCDPSETAVVTVRSAVGISAVRTSPRRYTFSGGTLPRRPGQLVSLYRLADGGGQVLTAQARTDSAGRWRVDRRFVGSGRFTFQARTGADLDNAAGASNPRPTVLH
jgi:hypothetical protein